MLDKRKMLATMAEHPYEMRFGTILRFVRTDQPTVSGLDVRNTLKELVASGHVNLRKMIDPTRIAPMMRFYSVRVDLMRQVGVNTRLKNDVEV